MATRTIDFEVTKKDGVQAFWIAVGARDVRLVNGIGSIDVDAPATEFLVWWFAGESGGKLAIVGKVGNRTVVEVKQSVIPPGQNRAAGAKRFTVQ